MKMIALLLSASWTVSAVCIADSSGQRVEGWQSVGGSVSRSEEHKKLKQSSLRWDFTPGATLLRAKDEALEEALRSREGGVKLWLYCEKPLAGVLKFHAGPWTFSVQLGFTGWRAVWVLFCEDAEKAAPVEGLRITAPGTSGTIFIDAIEIGPVPWTRQGDAHTPYTNPTRANGKYWFTPQDFAAGPVPPPAAECTAQDSAAFREIERRYENWMFGGLEKPTGPIATRLASVATYVQEGHQAFARLGLVRRGESVCGPGVFCEGDGQRPRLASEVFQPISLPLAYDGRLNGGQLARERFLDLIDYAHDQGWAAGSLMGTSYGEQLRIASYVHALYILRDFCQERGRLERELQTLHYQLALGEIYRIPDHAGATADDLRTLLLFRLLYVLMLPDSPGKVRDLRCLVRWADAALSVTPGYGGTIKPDGTVFHHATAYAGAYGNNAMLMSALVYMLLSDTKFALSRQCGENIKKALLTLRFMAGQYDFPMGVNGRWPFLASTMGETAPALAYLAEALKDRELGASFSRLWDPQVPCVQKTWGSCGARIYWCDSPGALPWLANVAARYPREPHPQGHQSYPFAAMNFHRRQQWVASVRGWSRYVWNYEELPGENHYGRYSSYGTLQILAQGEPVNLADSGYREQGWDWLRPPGATVIRVPLGDLYPCKVLPPGARGYTNESFVGGLALEGSHGLWAMRFADPHYEQSFRFRKSVFFVDQTIVCLGSGISNTDAIHPTETVLYQVALKVQPKVFPKAEARRTQWLVDPVGNGYYFPEPPVVETRTQHQQSMDNGATRQTAGDFGVAWLDHGAAPKDAGYCYAVRPSTTDQTLAHYAAAPDFEVLRRDDAAHVVRFGGGSIVGYVLFDPAERLAYDVLSAVDTPCLVMTRRDGDRLILAVADPDLRLGKPLMSNSAAACQPGGEKCLRIRLRGEWEILSGPAQTSDNRTFELRCRDGATYTLTLRRQAG